MLLTGEYIFTKEQLFADLQRDGVYVSLELLNRAKRGDGEAFYDIGILYISKEGNQDKILPWFLLSAEKNNPDAQYHIGLMHHYGQNASIDYLVAMEWYLKAAKQTHMRACMEIGYLYQNGYGVPANEQLAFQWFCKSKELSREKKASHCMEILELILFSEKLVGIEKERISLEERKRALDEKKRAQHQNEHQTLQQTLESFEQELTRKDRIIETLKNENQSILERVSQEAEKKENMMKHFENEKQQILTELNQTKCQATEKIHYLSQRNKTLEEKLETKNKQVSQLHNENCTLQNLLKLKQYQHEQQQSYQNKYLLQHQSNESKSLAESEQNNGPLLLKQENQKLLNEIKALNASNTQFEHEVKASKERLIMLQNINQSLRDSNDQMTKMTERLEKSNQNYVNVLEQDKQKISQEMQSLKQANFDLEKSMKTLLENAKNPCVTHISDQKPQNELKQKDRKLKALEGKYQALQTLYEQKMFEAHEMMTILNHQNEAAMISLEEEYQSARDENHDLRGELQSKMMREKKLSSKIESLENEVKHLKHLSASFEYETNL